MAKAISLAKKGLYSVSPNPMVGALIVKDDVVIGAGCHQLYGGEHAEIAAIKNAAASIAGARMYVTLEPCCHFGKTPPCTSAIIAQKPAEVIVACLDPNPLVAGKGIDLLKTAGIKTRVGILAQEARELNEKFFKFMETQTPFVTLKFAQSIDGRLATSTGNSQWISSLGARRYAHRLRSAHDAVLVGAGTVNKDNPRLTCRLIKGRHPLRVIVDSRLSISLDAAILKEQETAKTIIFAHHGVSSSKMEAINALGVEVITIHGEEHHLDIRALLTELGKRNITSLLVEGGAKVATAFLRDRLVDKMVVIIAPIIIGSGVSSVGDIGVQQIKDAYKLAQIKRRTIGTDMIIEGRPLYNVCQAFITL